MSAADAASGRVTKYASHQILWIRAFRSHTNSRRGINLSNTLRRHFPVTTLRVQARLRGNPGGRNAAVQKIVSDGTFPLGPRQAAAHSAPIARLYGAVRGTASTEPDTRRSPSDA